MKEPFGKRGDQPPEMLGLWPAILCAQAYGSQRFVWRPARAFMSIRPGCPPGPQNKKTTVLTVVLQSTPNEIRTRVARMKIWCPRPLDDGSPSRTGGGLWRSPSGLQALGRGPRAVVEARSPRKVDAHWNALRRHAFREPTLTITAAKIGSPTRRSVAWPRSPSCLEPTPRVISH